MEEGIGSLQTLLLLAFSLVDSVMYPFTVINLNHEYSSVLSPLTSSVIPECACGLGDPQNIYASQYWVSLDVSSDARPQMCVEDAETPRVLK